MKNSIEALHDTLNQSQIDYELFEDEQELHSARSGAEHYSIELTSTAPTFILKVDDRYIATIIQGDCRIDFNKLKKIFNTKNVSFASPDQIYEVTGAKIGFVSLINACLETWIDNLILEKEYVYGGCGIINVTLKISTNGLCAITGARLASFSKQRLS